MVRRLSLIFVFALAGRAGWPQGAPLGPEFRVNTYTTSAQDFPAVAADAAGNFVVVWSSFQDGSGLGVFGQRYAGSGNPLGGEFRVNTYTNGNEYFPSVAASALGDFVVVWMSEFEDGSDRGIFGRRFDASGTPLGAEFRVNTYTTGSQAGARVEADAAGNFVVTWQSYAQDGSDLGIFGQRYANTGVPLGPEFRVNTYTTGLQFGTSVELDASGNFVVVWASGAQDGSVYGLYGQRYSSSGLPAGPEFRVNTYTTSNQIFPSIASDLSGNFVVVWQSLGQDGSDYGIFGQRYASSGAPLGPEFRVNT